MKKSLWNFFPNCLFYNNGTLRNSITLYHKLNCKELAANPLELNEARLLIIGRSNGGGETGSLQHNSRSKVSYETGSRAIKTLSVYLSGTNCTGVCTVKFSGKNGPVMLGLTINSPCSSTCSTRRAMSLKLNVDGDDDDDDDDDDDEPLCRGQYFHFVY